MTAKTITVREDVYRMLVLLKRNNESFSELLERLAKSGSNVNKLKELRGFVEIDDKEMSEKRKEIIGFESETNSNKA